jgi:hypothetical protein
MSIELESEQLKEIIKRKLKINVMDRKRSRDIVDARMIYTKILRDRGYTVTNISSSINKDHTTIVYYMSIVDDIFYQFPAIKDRYITCNDEFMKDRGPLREHKDSLIRKKIESLETQVQRLEEMREYVEANKTKYRRLQNIIELIDSRTRMGEEKLMEKRINEMFNCY